MQRGDDALDRVVEQHRADADAHAELEARAWSLKNGSYWRTGLPLLLKMVQPLPTQRGLDRPGPPSASSGPRLGLDLLLDLAAEAVGVGEAELDLQALRRQRGADVGLAGQRGGAGRLPLRRVVGIRLLRAAEAIEVVDDARGGVLQQRRRRGVRVGGVEEAVELRLASRSATKPASESPSAGAGSGLPITAVPTTMPSVSKATSVRLRLGSLTRRGCSTR